MCLATETQTNWQQLYKDVNLDTFCSYLNKNGSIFLICKPCTSVSTVDPMFSGYEVPCVQKSQTICIRPGLHSGEKTFVWHSAPAMNDMEVFNHRTESLIKVW